MTRKSWLTLLWLWCWAPLAAQPSFSSLGQGAVYAAKPRPTVFIMSPQGGVEALDARTGSTLWHSQAACLPLAVRDGKLLALATIPPKTCAATGSLVLLDTTGGRLLGEVPGPSRLPAGVGAGVSSRSVLTARSEGDHDYLEWDASSWLAQGVAHSTPANFKQNKGLARIDWASGRVALCQEQLRPPSSDFESAGVRVSLSLEPPGPYDQASIVLHRKKGGKAFADVAVLGPGHVTLHPLWSNDRRWVGAVGQLPGITPTPNRQFQYEFALYDPATGQKVGQRVHYECLGTDFAVTGRVLVYVVAGHLAGLDLDTGKLLYQRELKDLSYRGPYPPSAPRPPAQPRP